MIIQEIRKKIEFSKAGKPYARVLLKFNEHQDAKGNMRWISGFGNKRTWEWEKGMDVEPEVTEKNGYLNFTFDDTDENRLDVYELPMTVGTFVEYIQSRKKERTSAPRQEEAPRTPFSS